jgi:hypothetical protein
LTRFRSPGCWPWGWRSAGGRIAVAGHIYQDREHDHPRQSLTATLLANGQVLVIGGLSIGALTSAGLYNPATGKWRATGSPGTARTGYTTTALQNGQVLLAGGDEQAAAITSSAEVHNSATDTWSATGRMTTARTQHTATLLPNGQVLAADGKGCCFGPARNCTPPPPAPGPKTARRVPPPRGTLLPSCCDGQVLFSGGLLGTYPAEDTVTGAAALLDPATDTVTASGDMSIPREYSTLTVLQTGRYWPSAAKPRTTWARPASPPPRSSTRPNPGAAGPGPGLPGT